MQKNSMKVNKKTASTFNSLKFFALNKEGTVEEVAAFIKRDYTTAMRIIRKLLSWDAIKLERLERTNVKGKEKRIYRIMLHGLFYFMLVDKETATSKFEEIAEAHRDKLLTFRKWMYFKEKGLEKVMRDRFFGSLRNWNVVRWNLFYLLSVRRGESSFPKMFSDENTAYAADVDILGLLFMLKPPGHLRQVVEKQEWNELMKLFKAIEEDYELRMFKEEVLFRLRKEREEALKALSQWRNFGS